jgi:tetratricopeptide (TPR) repeat protein
MAGTAQPTTNTLAVVLKELGWSQMQLVAALRREAARQRVTLPTTQSLVTLISRWVNNHQQPNEYYRGLLSGATARPRAKLFGDETALILPATAFPSATTVIQVASAIPDSFGSERSSRPRHIGEGTIRNLEEITAAYRRMYHTEAAPDLIGDVVQHTHTTRGFWLRTEDPVLRRRLAATTSEIAMLAGRMSFFDLGRPSAAGPYYGIALEAAQAADDKALEAVALGNRSFIPRNNGNTSEALTLLHRAKDLAADMPTIRSWTTALEAMTHAWAHQPHASMATMEQAERILGEARPDECPPWFNYYDRSRLLGFKGLMHLRLDQTDAAHFVLEEAITALSPDAAKQRACYLADRATVYVNEGEIDEACKLGMDALTILHEVEYATGVQRVRDLRVRLKPHHDRAAVADLTDQLLLAVVC